MTTPSDGSDERPKPRAIQVVFDDLRALTQTDGSLHHISKLIQRDWFLTVDMKEGKILGDPAKRWSLSRLNNNELMLLLGTAVQSQTHRTFSVLPQDQEFEGSADRLLREFHDAVTLDFISQNPTQFDHSEMKINAIAREAIYYGADSFFISQFEKFARYRYKDDSEWLLVNAGISIRPTLQIARFIIDRINLQMTYVANIYKESGPLDFGTLSRMLSITKDILRKEFGSKTDSFLAHFSSRAFNANQSFDNPFAVNQVNNAPLLDLGDFIYVPNEYRLMGSIYESPFYWTMADRAYRDKASSNRGKFVEKTASATFRKVFGEAYVYENVAIKEGKNTVAEADVLVAFGEFVIVVQAKSKRITMKARAGDAEALKTDFQGAIQDPYDQAFRFIELIESGSQCTAANGQSIDLPNIKRAFPVVLLSDGFPGMTLLSHMMLKRDKAVAPVIWDIAVLHTVTEILPTPVDFLFYLKCRSEAFDNISSDSEYNYLGYHLKLKLTKPSDCDFMQIDRDFAASVDDYMVAKELGAPAEQPIGILDRLKIPIISDLLTALKSAPPELVGIVIELYDFSSTSLEQFGKQIAGMRKEVRAGKVFKSASIQTPSGGITYLVAQKNDVRTKDAAQAIGHKYKYETRSDRWYVIFDDIGTNQAVDAILPILGKWAEDPKEIENSKFVSEMFGSQRVDTRGSNNE